ncbi:MAG: GNAT family N-acetyltransferase [Acidobacteriota bacterium]
MKPSLIRVRRAERKDASVFLSLVDALADYEKLDRPDESAKERLIEDAFGQFPRIEVFLVEINGQVVGYAIVLETYSSFLALPTLYLEDIFVLQEYRGLGAGRKLFTHCVREAFTRGCGRMEWAVLDWNRPSIDFYERLGARQMKEWLTYRLLRSDMNGILSGSCDAELE